MSIQSEEEKEKIKPYFKLYKCEYCDYYEMKRNNKDTNYKFICNTCNSQ